MVISNWEASWSNGFLGRIGKQEKLSRLLVCKSSEAKLGALQLAREIAGSAQQKRRLWTRLYTVALRQKTDS
jgi:hypothetical protein